MIKLRNLTEQEQRCSDWVTKGIFQFYEVDSSSLEIIPCKYWLKSPNYRFTKANIMVRCQFRDKKGNVLYTDWEIPDYYNTIWNTRKKLNTETRAEIDSLSPDLAFEIINFMANKLMEAGYHFAVFHARGQRSPHLIIYDLEELAELEQIQRKKAQEEFWQKIATGYYELLDKSMFDDEHPCPLEFAPHWKYQTPFNLIYEFLPEEECRS